MGKSKNEKMGVGQCLLVLKGERKKKTEELEGFMFMELLDRFCGDN